VDIDEIRVIRLYTKYIPNIYHSIYQVCCHNKRRLYTKFIKIYIPQYIYQVSCDESIRYIPNIFGIYQIYFGIYFVYIANYIPNIYNSIYQISWHSLSSGLTLPYCSKYSFTSSFVVVADRPPINIFFVLVTT